MTFRWLTFTNSRPRSVLHAASVWNPTTGGEYRHNALCGMVLPIRYITDEDGIETCIACEARIRALGES